MRRKKKRLKVTVTAKHIKESAKKLEVHPYFGEDASARFAPQHPVIYLTRC